MNEAGLSDFSKLECLIGRAERRLELASLAAIEGDHDDQPRRLLARQERLAHRGWNDPEIMQPEKFAKPNIVAP